MATSLFNFDPSPSFSFSDPGVNPMMQPVSILGQQSVSAPQQESFSNFNEGNLLSGLASLGAAVNESKSPSVTYRNYDFPEPPRASALSVFTQGGDLKPGIDVNEITPSPQAPPSLYAINTALNQQVPVESQSQGPGYFQRLGEFLEPVFNRDQGLFDVNRLNAASNNLLGSAMRNLTPVEDRRFANNEPFGKTFTDTFAITRPDGTKFYPDEIDQPAGIPMGPQTQESISPFLQSPDTPSGLGGPLLAGFNMVNEAARGPNAPMGRDATRAMLQERFGAPTISAIQSLPSGQGLGMRTDAQGRMISQGDDRTAFDQASQDRIARLEARPDFMTAYSDQELRDIAEAGRTESADTGVDTGVATRGEMTFEEARKFVPKGERETTKSYNQRIKAYQAQQNSAISKLKEQYEQFRVQGQVLNNQRIQAYIAQYQQTEPEKYRETLQVAQEMLRDGLLQDEVQMAMYVIDQMGGKSADIFDPATAFMGGDDGSGQTYTPEQEAKIERFMKANKLGREDALRELRNAGRIQ